MVQNLDFGNIFCNSILKTEVLAKLTLFYLETIRKRQAKGKTIFENIHLINTAYVIKHVWVDYLRVFSVIRELEIYLVLAMTLINKFSVTKRYVSLLSRMSAV